MVSLHDILIEEVLLPKDDVALCLSSRCRFAKPFVCYAFLWHQSYHVYSFTLEDRG